LFFLFFLFFLFCFFFQMHTSVCVVHVCTRHGLQFMIHALYLSIFAFRHIISVAVVQHNGKNQTLHAIYHASTWILHDVFIHK
jgi:hypothetical protein